MLPVGKLPPSLLARILPEGAPDPRLILGPGVGLDCAVVDLGDRMLAFKSDPITFTSDSIGWYAVQVNANDIVTVGAAPRWFLPTLLLPGNGTTSDLVENIMEQINLACRDLGISVVGGHTEITHSLKRPIMAGTMIGEISPGQLVTPRGAAPGDRLLLTKGVPIEGTAILAREFEPTLSIQIDRDDLEQAREYLFNPGISVVRDAQIACGAGSVTAMHDPTEGGLAAALWELATACERSLVVETEKIPISDISRRICQSLGLDPLSTIASGALLLSVRDADADKICHALVDEGINCTAIGKVEAGPTAVWGLENGKRISFPYPERDEIARMFESG
jgi:hydrogenase expression/formation protein HypE